MKRPELLLEFMRVGLRAQLAADVATWNAQHPVGTPVRFWTGVRRGQGHLSKTRTPAQVLGGHTAVVWVEGQSGCLVLSHVQPERLQRTPHRRPRQLRLPGAYWMPRGRR